MSAISSTLAVIFGALALVQLCGLVRAVRRRQWATAWPALTASIMSVGMATMASLPVAPRQLWMFGYATLALVLVVEAVVRLRRRALGIVLQRCGGAGCSACMAYMFAVDSAGMPAVTWVLAAACALYGVVRLVTLERGADAVRHAAPQLVMAGGMATMLIVAAPTQATTSADGSASSAGSMPAMHMGSR